MAVKCQKYRHTSPRILAHPSGNIFCISCRRMSIAEEICQVRKVFSSKLTVMGDVRELTTMSNDCNNSWFSCSWWHCAQSNHRRPRISQLTQVIYIGSEYSRRRLVGEGTGQSVTHSMASGWRPGHSKRAYWAKVLHKQRVVIKIEARGIHMCIFMGWTYGGGAEEETRTYHIVLARVGLYSFVLNNTHYLRGLTPKRNSRRYKAKQQHKRKQSPNNPRKPD